MDTAPSPSLGRERAGVRVGPMDFPLALSSPPVGERERGLGTGPRNGLKLREHSKLLGHPRPAFRARRFPLRDVPVVGGLRVRSDPFPQEA